MRSIRAGKLCIGCCITFSDPSVTEMAAEAGFDFCWIDGEHGEMDRNTALMHIMALKGTDCAPFFRVPACDHTEIKKVIDFAPAGIIVPMIMDADDARRAVQACRYPPAGNRGCGMRRGNVYGTVPGVDSIMIGPYDLSCTLGKPGQWDDPEIGHILDDICLRTRNAGKILGTYAEGDFARWERRGVQYIGCINDTGALFHGFQMMRDRVRKEFRSRKGAEQ